MYSTLMHDAFLFSHKIFEDWEPGPHPTDHVPYLLSCIDDVTNNKSKHNVYNL